MTISFKRYVDIVSGVGAGAGVRLRDLIGRVFTNNPRLPPASYAEFSSADDVGLYFGTGSTEYRMALFYFGFISKSITRANKISFAAYADTARAPRIYGTSSHSTLVQLKAITAGTLDLTLGAYFRSITALNFSAAVDLAGVASILQTAIRAAAAGDAQWAAATVAFDAQANAFALVGGLAGGLATPTPVSINPTTAGSIAPAMGWLAPSAIFAPGAIVQSAVEAFTASHLVNDNFGSFTFASRLLQADWDAVLRANDALNVKFMGLVPVPDITTGQAYYAMWAGLSGGGLVLSPLAPPPSGNAPPTQEFPELAPMALLAATDYSKRNAVQNYMYQIFTLSPTVTSNADADLADASRINYYGRTQTAGQPIDFFQRGVLLGLPVDPVDMNVYANEMWFKDLVGATIMSLLLSLSRVSANVTGRAQLIAIIMSVIGQAVFNGTISLGKSFTTVQKLYISQLTGDALAWYQVQNIGYWLDCVMSSYVTPDGRTEWKAVYTLIYSKDDAIRKVEGSHVLI